MALMLLLRTGSKFNALELARTSHIVLAKKYTTTIVAPQHALTAKPLTLLEKHALPLPLTRRNITLTTPRMSPFTNNHTPVWTAERLVSLALVAVFPLAFAVPSQATDAMLAIALVLHVHWGCEAMVTDYLRPSLVGNAVSKASHITLFILSIVTLAGLFYLIHNDIGITPTVKKVWAIKGKENEPPPPPPPPPAEPPVKTAWFGGDIRKVDKRESALPPQTQAGDKPKGWFSSSDK